MASALATVCLLNGSSSQDALAHFLQQRTHALAAFAARPPEPTAATPSASTGPDAGRTPGDTGPLISHACTMAAMVQDALFHAILLFMDGDPLDVGAGMMGGTGEHSSHKTGLLGTWKSGAAADWNGMGAGPGGALEPGPMITRALVADSHASAELLFDALPGAPQGDSEAEAWDAALKQQLQRMPPLSTEDVRRACAAWLHDLPAATPGLLSAAACCADLAAVSEAVRAALPRWTPRGGAAAAAAASGGGDAAAHWPAVASTALGRTADVWGTVFEPCALRCAGTIVGAAVRRAAAAAHEHLSACRAAAAAAAAAASAQPDAPGECTAAAEWSSGTGTAPWRAALPEARALLDTAVRATLADAMALLARGDGGFSRAQAEARRVETLEQHVHSAVVEGAQNLASELSALQNALPHDAHSRCVALPISPYPLCLPCLMLV